MPVEDSPQIIKVADKIQKAGCFSASNSTWKLVEKIFISLFSGGRKISFSPKGGKPKSEGQLREKSKNNIAERIPPPIGISKATRQSATVVIHAITGTNNSWPAAKAEAKTPTTSPRRATNHLVATVAASPKPIMPAAAPTKTPIVTSKCHSLKASIVRKSPLTLSPIANMPTLRKPIFSISAPAKGAQHPSTTNMTPIAFDTSDICQPNSEVIGRIMICGTLETADEHTVIIKAIMPITQP